MSTEWSHKATELVTALLKDEASEVSVMAEEKIGGKLYAGRCRIRFPGQEGHQDLSEILISYGFAKRVTPTPQKPMNKPQKVRIQTELGKVNIII